MSARRRPLADDDVQLVVLKRGVEEFLQRRLQAVDFINKEHLLVADVGQNGRQVTFDL